MDGHGTWSEVPDYGQCGVRRCARLAPYRNGRWVYEPYGDGLGFV